MIGGTKKCFCVLTVMRMVKPQGIPRRVGLLDTTRPSVYHLRALHASGSRHPDLQRLAPRPSRDRVPPSSAIRLCVRRPSSSGRSDGTMAAGSRRLYALSAHFAVGASIWGYNIGILSSILVHPGWRTALGGPSASQRGAVTAIYYAGTFLSYVLLAHPLADGLGRRRAALVGAVVLCAGADFMAGAGADGRGRASALALTLLGRLVSGVGVGVGVVSTTVPLYQR